MSRPCLDIVDGHTLKDIVANYARNEQLSTDSALWNLLMRAIRMDKSSDDTRKLFEEGMNVDTDSAEMLCHLYSVLDNQSNPVHHCMENDESLSLVGRIRDHVEQNGCPSEVVTLWDNLAGLMSIDGTTHYVPLPSHQDERASNALARVFKEPTCVRTMKNCIGIGKPDDWYTCTDWVRDIHECMILSSRMMKILETATSPVLTQEQLQYLFDAIPTPPPLTHDCIEAYKQMRRACIKNKQ